MPIMMARFPAVTGLFMIQTVKFSKRKLANMPSSGKKSVRNTPAAVRPSKMTKAVPKSKMASRFFARNARNAAEAT